MMTQFKLETAQENKIQLEFGMSISDLAFSLWRSASKEELLELIKQIDAEVREIEFTEAIAEHANSVIAHEK